MTASKPGHARMFAIPRKYRFSAFKTRQNRQLPAGNNGLRGKQFFIAPQYKENPMTEFQRIWTSWFGSLAIDVVKAGQSEGLP